MAEHPSTTVVRDGMVWTGGPSPQYHDRTDLVVENGVVASLEPNYRGRADVEIDAEGCLVVPGLVNCHTHAGCTPPARGVAEDLDLPEAGAFYHSVVPLLSLLYEHVTRDEFLAIMEWDATAMLLGGATTVVEENFGGADAWIELVDRLGFRSSLGLTYPGNVTAIGFVQDGKVVRDDPGDVASGLQRGLALHDDWHGAFGDRLRVHLSPHASDTVPEEVLRETKRLAGERGLTIHLHLAQHLSEIHAIAQSRDGQSPVRYLEEIGFLGPDVLATHVTYTDANDWDALARTGATVVHCPYRKAKEGLTSPFYEYVSRGVNVALATDSFSHDLVEDLRLAALLGKVREGAVGRPRAEEVLSCATWGAARALGRDDLGRLDPGARGDALVMDLGSPFTFPVLHPLRSLVYYSSSAAIRHSLVDGQPVVRDGSVVGSDTQDVARRAASACERIWTLAVAEGALPPGTSYSRSIASPT